MTAQFDFGTLGQPFEADWPVTVNVPQDGGTVEPQTFVARFRLLDPETLEAAKTSEDADAFPKAFWIGFGAAEKTAFDETVIRQVLARQYVRRALMDAYFQFATGIPAKN